MLHVAGISQNGYTALHIAAKKNQIETATYLLDHGARVNAESKASISLSSLSRTNMKITVVRLTCFTFPRL